MIVQQDVKPGCTPTEFRTGQVVTVWDCEPGPHELSMQAVIVREATFEEFSRERISEGDDPALYLEPAPGAHRWWKVRDDLPANLGILDTEAELVRRFE